MQSEDILKLLIFSLLKRYLNEICNADLAYVPNLSLAFKLPAIYKKDFPIFAIKVLFISFILPTKEGKFSTRYEILKLITLISIPAPSSISSV